jgi:transcriptional regulator
MLDPAQAPECRSLYIPTHFRETRLDVLHGFVTRFPLATLIALTPEGISANHVPMLWISAADELGRLQGHVAKANPLWRDAAADAAVLAIFTGPQHYVSPSWYPVSARTARSCRPGTTPACRFAAASASSTMRRGCAHWWHR